MIESGTGESRASESINGDEDSRSSRMNDPAWGFNRGSEGRVGVADTEVIDKVDTGDGVVKIVQALGVGIGTARIVEVWVEATGEATEYDTEVDDTEIRETGTEFSSARVFCGGQ